MVGIVISATPDLKAQSLATAALRGTVVDKANNNQLIGATVRLTGPQQDRQATATDANGTFYFSNLPAGSYQLIVTMIGFQKEIVSGIVLKDGREKNLEVILSRGTVDLDKVVVTAGRKLETVSDIPASVTVIDGKEIQALQSSAINAGDILGKLVPGLAVGMQSPSTYGQSLRGRPVSVMIDGVPMSTTRNVSRDFANIDPSLIERVEVVRGSTAMYGDGATGGIINIITQSPTVRSGVHFTSYLGTESALSHTGSGNGYRFSQGISGRQNRWTYSLKGSVAQTGNFYDAKGDIIPPDPHGQGGLANTFSYDLNGKLGYNWKNQQLRFSANYLDSDQNTDYISDPSIRQFDPGTHKAEAIKGLDLAKNQGTRNLMTNLQYRNQNLLGSQLSAQLYYRNYETVFRPFDGRPYGSIGKIIQSYLDSEKIGGRFDFNTQISSWVSILWGADFVHESTAQPVYIFDEQVYDQSNGLKYNITDQDTWVPRMEPNNLGLFAQLSLNVTDALSVKGGFRYERARMKIDDFNTIAGAQVRSGELAYDPILFNLGAVLQVTESVRTFANYSQGFSLSDVGLLLRSAPDGYEVGNKSLKAQKVNNYELGISGAWEAVSFTLAGYYNQSDLGTTSGGFDLNVIRAPERIYGFESTLDIRPVDKLEFSTTLSWVEGGNDADEDGSYQPLNGYRIQPLKWTVRANYQVLPSWNTELSLLYSGSRDRAFEERVDPTRVGFGEYPIDSYTVVDWINTLNVGPGTLNLSVKNLLNNQYFPVVSQLMRTGGNDSFAAARGAVMEVSYTLSF